MIVPDLLYSVLCDEVRREDNGKLMLLGLFEQIAVAQFPVQHPACCIVNKWCNGEGSWTQLTRFVDEDDRVLMMDQPITFELFGLDAHFTAVQIFAGLTLNAPGRVFIEVLLNGELTQRYALHVLAVENQMTQSP
ncbi:MAG TPA: hypothetical protein VNA16_01795 [Abditibacteriaceae bacterium]|nr:hypothetical protein [Abditibacteriaceae bacterium]